jgi:Fe-S oxidoreductase
MNVYDAPRMVLAQIPGLILIEPYWTREKAVCCGAGGGLGLTNPAIANDAARRTAHMFALSNPQVITTGCSRCKSSLQAVLTHVEVLELAELVARVLV